MRPTHRGGVDASRACLASRWVCACTGRHGVVRRETTKKNRSTSVHASLGTMRTNTKCFFGGDGDITGLYEKPHKSVLFNVRIKNTKVPTGHAAIMIGTQSSAFLSTCRHSRHCMSTGHCRVVTAVTMRREYYRGSWCPLHLVTPKHPQHRPMYIGCSCTHGAQYDENTLTDCYRWDGLLNDRYCRSLEG